MSERSELYIGDFLPTEVIKIIEEITTKKEEILATISTEEDYG